MKKTRIDKIPEYIPQEILRLTVGADLYDSSCSPEARVYFIDRDNGYYLKIANGGTLAREALMTEYFHKRGLGADVLSYVSSERDYLLTRSVVGEDCTYADYLSDPRRLAELIATRLRALHELDASDCPVKDRVSEYIALAEANYRTDNYDKSHFPDSFGYESAEAAYAALHSGKHLLKNEVLIHGDYCLPNIMLDGWRFSGFIDVDHAGIGDRHIDLFWGAWTLGFNLGTDKYRDIFLDAYGRDKINDDALLTVAAAEVFG